MNSPVNEIFKSLSSLKEELNQQNKENLKQKNLEKVKQFLLEKELLSEKDNRQFIVDKLGLPQEVADYAHNWSDKYSIWIANQIKEYIEDYNSTFNRFKLIYEHMLPNIISMFKDDNRPNIDIKNINFGDAQELTNLYGYVKDWRDNPNVPSINLRNMSWDEAENLSREWHESLGKGGRVSNILDEKDKIIHKFSNGFYWVLREDSFCEKSKDSMGHCAKASSSDMYLFRLIKNDEEFITADWNPTKRNIIQLKGKANTKPKEIYYPYIIWLIADSGYIKELKSYVWGFKPETNFHLSNLDNEQLEYVCIKNPNLVTNTLFEPDSLGYYKEFKNISEEAYNIIFNNLLKNKDFINKLDYEKLYSLLKLSSDPENFINILNEYGNDKSINLIKRLTFDTDFHFSKAFNTDFHFSKDRRNKILNTFFNLIDKEYIIDLFRSSGEPDSRYKKLLKFGDSAISKSLDIGGKDLTVILTRDSFRFGSSNRNRLKDLLSWSEDKDNIINKLINIGGQDFINTLDDVDVENMLNSSSNPEKLKQVFQQYGKLPKDESPVNEIFKSLSSLKEELNQQNKENLKQKNLEKVKQFLLERQLLKENIDLISHTSVNNLKNHNLYSEAKTGDLRFAKELIKYLVKEEKIKEIINKFPNANLVPLVKTGRTNKIPYAYALYLKSKNRNYKIANITQINKIKKTERSGIYRLINVNEFSGEIIPNENYIIIDDVITTGSTIKSLENFIKENGGNVVLITTLASASNPLLGHASKNYNFNQELFDLIEKNIGVENVQNLFKKYGHDVQLDKLTSNQLKILSIYKDINKLEDKLKIEKNMPLNEIFESLTSLQEELNEQNKVNIKQKNLEKVKQFLLERQMLNEISIQDAYEKFYKDKISKNDFDKIIKADPFSNPNFLSPYAKWLLNIYKKKNLRLEDLEAATEYIQTYNRYKDKYKNVDWNKLNTLADLYNVIKDDIAYSQAKTGTVNLCQPINGSEKFYEDSNWCIIIPKTEYAACYYGRNTEWCTAWGEMSFDERHKGKTNRFDEHDEGPLYIIINKNNQNEKYQFHFPTGQFMDVNDKQMSEDNPIFKEILNIFLLNKKFLKSLNWDAIKILYEMSENKDDFIDFLEKNEIEVKGKLLSEEILKILLNYNKYFINKMRTYNFKKMIQILDDERDGAGTFFIKNLNKYVDKISLALLIFQSPNPKEVIDTLDEKGDNAGTNVINNLNIYEILDWFDRVEEPELFIRLLNEKNTGLGTKILEKLPKISFGDEENYIENGNGEYLVNFWDNVDRKNIEKFIKLFLSSDNFFKNLSIGNIIRIIEASVEVKSEIGQIQGFWQGYDVNDDKRIENGQSLTFLIANRLLKDNILNTEIIETILSSLHSKEIDNFIYRLLENESVLTQKCILDLLFYSPNAINVFEKIISNHNLYNVLFRKFSYSPLSFYQILNSEDKKDKLRKLIPYADDKITHIIH